MRYDKPVNIPTKPPPTTETRSPTGRAGETRER